MTGRSGCERATQRRSSPGASAAAIAVIGVGFAAIYAIAQLTPPGPAVVDAVASTPSSSSTITTTTTITTKKTTTTTMTTTTTTTIPTPSTVVGNDLEPPSFVSLSTPEGVMTGETFVADVECSRPINADDQPWLSFRSSGYDAEEPIVTANMIAVTSRGFKVSLPVPSDFNTGAFQATAGCQGPEIEVGFTVPASVAGPPQWVIIRPNKQYSKFVSIAPTEVEVGGEVTVTVVCSLPPARAGLTISAKDGPTIVEVTSPDRYRVDGNSFSAAVKIPEGTATGEYPMEAHCDAMSDRFDYYPPPTSYSDGLIFTVLSEKLPPLR